MSENGCKGSIKEVIPDWEAKLNSFVLLLIMLVSLFGNSLVCVTIYLHKSMQTRTNVLVFSLSLTDLMSPVTCMLWVAVSMLHNKWIFGCTWCKLSTCLGTFLCLSSIIHLLVISLERMLMINYPYKYPELVTKKSVLSVLTFIWLFSFLMGMSYFFDLNFLQFNSYLLDCDSDDVRSNPILSLVSLSCFFIFPFSVMLGVYISIYQSVKKQAENLVHNSIGSKRQKNKQMLKREWKAVKIVFAIIGAFFLLWCPYFTVAAVYSYTNEKHHVPNWLIRFVWTLAYANSCCNWIIYSVMNKKTRKMLKKVLHIDLRKKEKLKIQRGKNILENGTNTGSTSLDLSDSNQSANFENHFEGRIFILQYHPTISKLPEIQP